MFTLWLWVSVSPSDWWSIFLFVQEEEELGRRQVLVLGLDGAGKSSMLQGLAPGEATAAAKRRRCRPTRGFNFMSMNATSCQLDFLESKSLFLLVNSFVSISSEQSVPHRRTTCQSHQLKSRSLDICESNLNSHSVIDLQKCPEWPFIHLFSCVGITAVKSFDLISSRNQSSGSETDSSSVPEYRLVTNHNWCCNWIFSSLWNFKWQEYTKAVK